MTVLTMYVRHRPLFKTGRQRLGPILCALLAAAPTAGRAEQGPATSRPVDHRLVVRVDPARFGLGGGRVFEEAELLRALSARLASWKLRVVRANEVAGPGAIWRLHIRARGRAKGRARALTISFRDPSGRQVMLRRLPLRRYRPYDLAQTISLSTLESLVAVLDPVKFPGLAPPEKLSPATQPTTRPASLPHHPLSPSQPPEAGPSGLRRWALGIELAGGVAVPGDEALGGLGLSARLRGERWMTQLVINAWLPLSVAGEGYDLDVYLITAYLGGGIRHRVGRWILGATGGAALRLAAEDRRGERVVEGSWWRASGGFGGRLQLGYGISPALEVQAFFGFLGIFPAASYTLHGVELLEVGSILAMGGLSLVLSP